MQLYKQQDQPTISLESIKHTQSLCWVTASPSSRQNQVPVVGKNSADKRLVFPDWCCCSYRVNQPVQWMALLWETGSWERLEGDVQMLVDTVI